MVVKPQAASIKKESRLLRGLQGALLGAVITFAIGFVTISLVLWLSSSVFDTESLPEGVLVAMLNILPKLTLIFAAIGGIAGLAARLPRHGMRMLPSIGVVALITFMGCGFLLHMVYPPLKGRLPPPFPIAFITTGGMAFLGGLFVLLYGKRTTKRLSQQDVKNPPSNDQPVTSNADTLDDPGPPLLDS